MRTLFLIIILSFSLVAMSCNHDPEPINFNSDQCALCKMTIEDTRFGAELISKKGKVFKFDAAECMVKYINKGKISEGEIGKLYVIDYSQPTVLVDALLVTFLISENLPSPMGANLSAFLNRSTAEKYQSEKGGELFNWEGVKSKLKK